MKEVADKREELAERFISFYDSFLVAGIEGMNSSTCTVVVGASKGTGAIVKYAKAADAVRMGAFKDMGFTLVTQEIERAEYIFKSYRSGKETGSTGRVPCVSSTKPVTVTIPEN
jgi:hypothetical protein